MRADQPSVAGPAGHALQTTHRRHIQMNLIALRHKTGRLALVTATTGFALGLAFLNGGASHAIRGGFPRPPPPPPPPAAPRPAGPAPPHRTQPPRRTAPAPPAAPHPPPRAP